MDVALLNVETLDREQLLTILASRSINIELDANIEQLRDIYREVCSLFLCLFVVSLIFLCLEAVQPKPQRQRFARRFHDMRVSSPQERKRKGFVEEIVSLLFVFDQS